MKKRKKRESVSFLEAALDLARRGFSVVPLKPRSKKPAMRQCYVKATANQEKIRNWWKREPSLNIGVVPAARGLCVIDVDGALGEQSLTFDGWINVFGIGCINLNNKTLKYLRVHQIIERE